MNVFACTIACMLSLLLTLSLPASASDNLVLVTIDGLRWQEVFHGLDNTLANNDTFTHRKQSLLEEFAGEQAAQKLMPFFHQTLAQQGILFGDRQQGQCMKLSNPWYFSYPGYNEILTGQADPSINTNEKTANPNVTFLEWLYRQKPFNNAIYAFGSWDVFPYTINTERSGVPVNAGFQPAKGHHLTAMERHLNTLQTAIPSPWETVRLDAFTHHYALETLKKHKPRVLYIAYGETDDFAHDGEYDQYLLAAHRTDRFIDELWQTLQSMRQYRDKTTLIVTTDHGRGSTAADWQHHASRQAMQGYMKALASHANGIEGSDDVWFAALGPDIRNTANLQRAHCLSSNQIAATALTALGLDWTAFNPKAGQPVAIFH